MDMALLGLRSIFRLQRYIIALLFASFILGMVLGIMLVSNSDTKIFGLLHTGHSTQDSSKVKPIDKYTKKSAPSKTGSIILDKIAPQDLDEKPQKHAGRPGNRDKLNKKTPRPLLKVPLDKSRAEDEVKDETKNPEPSYDVHAFYYPWYGNPDFDRTYLHWNHIYLPHWDKKEDAKWPKGQHVPPDDVGSNFYPELGPYSSRDPKVMHNHMQQLQTAGVGKLDCFKINLY